MIRLAGSRAVLLLTGALFAGLAAWFGLAGNRLSGLVYSRPDGIPLTLDLDYPAERNPPPPVVLFGPHDGEWKPELHREPRCRKLTAALTGRGYAVATVHFRNPGKSHFPAPLEDGKAAVRWLRANAAAYGLNGERIGAIGVSAGGYGVCMLGTAGPEDGLDGDGGNPQYSGRVQAVVAMGAPADFADEHMPEAVQRLYVRPFLGTSRVDDPGLRVRASPGTYASKDDPPFLLFHSVDDLSVPVGQARSFAGKLRRAGVAVELIEEEGYEHVWSGDKFERAVARTLQFFDRHLKTP